MQTFGQRELMQKLFAEFDGDRQRVIQAYTEADARGEVRRSRNTSGTPSREYAVRLWANGMYHGWLSTGTAHVADKPRVTVSRKVTVGNPAFEAGLREIALSWLNDPSRPSTTPEARAHWKALILEWCEDQTMLLPIRKSGHRGILFSHPSGRGYVLCDNSPAHWAFMGCYANHVPTLGEVKQQIESGTFPMTFARSRAESALLAQGNHNAFGGFLAKSAYGQANRFSDGLAYKLCHLDPVGLGSRGEVTDFKLDDLKRHVVKLLDPSNMIVVPLQYAGVGECEAFLRAFREARSAGEQG